MILCAKIPITESTLVQRSMVVPPAWRDHASTLEGLMSKVSGPTTLMAVRRACVICLEDTWCMREYTEQEHMGVLLGHERERRYWMQQTMAYREQV